MPQLAWNKCKDAVKNLLEDVMGLPEDNDVWKALAFHASGTDQLDIYMVTRMDYNNIWDLGYRSIPKAAICSVSKGLATLLINFQKMYWECEQARNTMVN